MSTSEICIQAVTYCVRGKFDSVKGYAVICPSRRSYIRTSGMEANLTNLIVALTSLPSKIFEHYDTIS
jgi:hypothetical protein